MSDDVAANIQNPKDRLAIILERNQETYIDRVENKLTEIFSVKILSGTPEGTMERNKGTIHGHANGKYYHCRVRRTVEDADKPNPFSARTKETARKLANMHPLAILLGSDIEPPQEGETWSCRYSTKDRKGLVLIERVQDPGPDDNLSPISDYGGQSFCYKGATATPARAAGAPFKGGTVGDYKSSTDDGEPSQYGDKYKGVTIQGSVYPDAPIKSTINITPNKHIRDKYLPALERALPNEPKGLKLLATAQAIKEGFWPNTRAYRHNNPGNIGNTDSGENVGYSTLEDGIKKQKNYLLKVAEGRHRAYPLGKQKTIKPYYSKEIAKNQKTYKKSPYLPGYSFVYTGQLDQFVKIYATSSRSGNNYLNMILSYFSKNGIALTPQSKIQDIVKMQ